VLAASVWTVDGRAEMNARSDDQGVSEAWQWQVPACSFRWFIMLKALFADLL
jgi:hypothetical protein